MVAPSADTFPQFLELAYSHHVPIAGSVGRAALIGDTAIAPVRPDGSPRDIDIVNVGPHAVNASQLPRDLEFDRIWLSRFIDGGDLIYPGRNDSSSGTKETVRVPLPYLEVILEPMEGRAINGVPCVTLRPEVQLALDNMFGSMSSKNRPSVARLAEIVAATPTSERLDDTLLQPFSEYATAVQGLWRRKFYAAARTVYHATLPVSLKRATHPLVKKVARKGLV